MSKEENQNTTVPLKDRVYQANFKLIDSASAKSMLDDLTTMFFAYLGSDFADPKPARQSCSYTFELLGAFLTDLNKIEKQQKQAGWPRENAK
ncbi:hypothetical protein [Aequorivita echinoideorum]|uniref:Uncharacterized protein n=1 Tax=Aequorivita echinoideorum TaxID=1549647 RepID=A0ABS5S372_9FLAO|nr:hypothetical protein [Aequorivita echinoideorum]MBT0607654.1 hypothetical protein [Aequorivita echinoideorum]